MYVCMIDVYPAVRTRALASGSQRVLSRPSHRRLRDAGQARAGASVFHPLLACPPGRGISSHLTVGWVGHYYYVLAGVY